MKIHWNGANQRNIAWIDMKLGSWWYLFIWRRGHWPFMPGDRVKVYEYRRFVNDIETPVDDLMLPATVVARYGKTVDYGNGPVQYPDLVDVRFDHDPEFVSHGHFTRGIEVIEVA